MPQTVSRSLGEETGRLLRVRIGWTETSAVFLAYIFSSGGRTRIASRVVESAVHLQCCWALENRSVLRCERSSSAYRTSPLYGEWSDANTQVCLFAERWIFHLGCFTKPLFWKWPVLETIRLQMPVRITLNLLTRPQSQRFKRLKNGSRWVNLEWKKCFA